MAVKFCLILITFCILVMQVDSACNVCQKNYAACLDEKRFSICNGGEPGPIIYTCPDGEVCTSKTSVCVTQSLLKPVTPSCEMTCGQCNSPGNLFACLSNTTYAMCFGENVPTLSAKGVCPEGYVCSLSSAQICKEATETSPSCNALLEENNPVTSPATTLKSTNPDHDETTPKTQPPLEEVTRPSALEDVIASDHSSTVAIVPVTTTSQPVLSTSSTELTELESNFCKEKSSRGPYRSKNDPTCQKYTLCYMLAGQYLELQYTCLGSEYFNEQTRGCHVGKPPECQTM